MTEIKHKKALRFFRIATTVNTAAGVKKNWGIVGIGIWGNRIEFQVSCAFIAVSKVRKTSKFCTALQLFYDCFEF